MKYFAYEENSHLSFIKKYGNHVGKVQNFQLRCWQR